MWSASYMGVPFYFERDDSEGGRAVKVHEFPNSETSYVEDLGRKTRIYSGTAYVTGNDADTQATALKSIFETKGPGTLVVPIAGPVSVHCEHFKRTADKDKFGFIAFTVKFVLAGAPAALVSVPLLGQQIFDAADTVAAAAADLFPDALTLSNPANYVITAPVDEVTNIVAAIETVRQSNPIDADTSAQVAAADAAILTAAPLLISYGNPAAARLATAPAAALVNSPNPEVAAIASAIVTLVAAAPPLDEIPSDPTAVIAAVIVATIRLLAEGMENTTDAGAGAMLSLSTYFPAPAASASTSPNALDAAANGAAIINLARVASLAAWCEALERQSYASRPDGVAARAAAAEQLGIEFGNWTGGPGAAVYMALQDLQGAAVQYLTQLITNLAPVVTVTAPQSMPSLWWAWRLYGDPTRAVDLVLRNRIIHPSFMPTSLQALAPGYAAPASLATAWPAPG